MEIAGRERIADFAGRYPRLATALARWVNVVEAAEWQNPAQMKRTFGSADIVGNQTVFNVGGNKCPLIALVHYSTRRMLIQYVLTHREYDEGDWKS